MYVISPEDIILAKLEWYRMGGEVSERQWEDVLGVLKVRAGELDLDYMRRWANELGWRICWSAPCERRRSNDRGSPAGCLRR